MKFDLGQKPFSDISAEFALASLRGCLGILAVSDAHLFRTHDLRRGHADDMRRRGCTAYQILMAGGWTSPAFLSMKEVESDAVVDAHAVVSDHLEDSDSGEE